MREENDNSKNPRPVPKASFTLKHYVAAFFVLVIIVMMLKGPTGAYVSSIFASTEYGLSLKTLTETAWTTRWYIGRFRGPLTDEDMIEKLRGKRAEFDSLAKAYYDNVAESRSYEAANKRLLAQLRSLGLWQIEPGGALLQPNFGNQAPTFTDQGVSFKILDHGAYPWWSFGRKNIKSYLYMPDIPPHPGSSSNPIDRLLSTGEYRLEASTDRPVRPILDLGCAIRQIDNHWFVQACDASTLIDIP